MRNKTGLTAAILTSSLAIPVMAQVAGAPPAVEPPRPVQLAPDRANVAQLRADLEYRRALEGQMATEKACYLGTHVTSVIPAARAQLNLDKGVGLVVTRIDAGSPAEIAGIKPNDILEKLGDQLLVNSQQLNVLVRSHKDGDEVKLAILRGGERQVVNVKLAETDVPVAAEIDGFAGRFYRGGAGGPGVGGGGGGGVMTLDGAGNAWIGGGDLAIKGPQGNLVTKHRGNIAEQSFEDDKYKVNVTIQNDQRLTVVVDKATGKVVAADDATNTDVWRKNLAPDIQDVLKKMDDMQKNNQARIVMADGRVLMATDPRGADVIRQRYAVNVATNAANRRLPHLPSAKVDAITWNDEENTFDITATQNGDHRDLHLVCKNAEGTIVFDGPINTDEDKQALPKDIAEKLNSPTISPVLDVMRGNVATNNPNAIQDFRPNNNKDKAPRLPGLQAK